MFVWLIFIACYIIIALLLRYNRNNKEKKWKNNSMSASKKQSMNEDSKKVNHILPRRERIASGSNWKTFKSAVLNSATLDGKNVSNQPKSMKMSLIKQNMSSMGQSSTTANKKQRKELTMSKISSKDTLNMEKKKTELTKQIAMDCEMVGIGDGVESMVARVSIVNRHGYCVYDKYVKPIVPVIDYRTEVSGIRPHNLQNGEEFTVVKMEVAQILKGRILVGHALSHDLRVLHLSHPRRMLRDTSQYKPFRQLSKGGTPSLKTLAYELLGTKIQTGEHSSVEDAQAVMQVYLLYKNIWESELHSGR